MFSLIEPTSWIPALTVAGFFLLLAPRLPRQQTWARGLVVGFGMTLALRYLWWRWFVTLELNEWNSVQGWWMLLIMAAEVAAVANFALLYVTLLRTSDRSGQAFNLELELRRTLPQKLPSVDVFIPTYNEGPEVLCRTILGALALDYPNFTVYVLDDGKRPWLRRFCQQVGARYLARTKNTHYKAGNLNHGLAHSNGELFAIFDADFVPLRHFLYRTGGFFRDPSIGIVQTPQHFFNQDPIQSNLNIGDCYPDEQRLFFDIIAPSRDAWGAAFCCGSCSIQRRSAVLAAGGVPTESVTEDILSSLVLLRHGYRTIYLNQRLSHGLAAQSLDGFFVQRQRWCRGALQTLFLRAGPLGPGLRLGQRLLFFPLDWLVQYPWRLLMLVVPAVFLWTGLKPFQLDNVDQLISNQLPVLIAFALIMRFLAPGHYLPILSTATSTLVSFRIVPSIISTLIKPFGAPFRVTPKGDSATDSSDRFVLWAVLLLLAANIGGVLINRVPGWTIVEDSSFYVAASAFALFNCVVLVLVGLMGMQQHRPRSEQRFPIGQDVFCEVDQEKLWGKLVDMSATGAALEFPHPLALGQKVSFHISDVGMITGQVIRVPMAMAPPSPSPWRWLGGRRRPEPAAPRGRQVGIRFLRMPEAQFPRLLVALYTTGLTNAARTVRAAHISRKLLRRALA